MHSVFYVVIFESIKHIDSAPTHSQYAKLIYAKLILTFGIYKLFP